MPEAVRLVIWDLDETFWKGTLTEGGIQQVEACHEIVRTLARRGIMSSICSKNDHETVRKLLEERGSWQYFVFPSINWEPKGRRVADLVEAVQLRPASVMFVDDNPMNLREALHFAPGLQTADETFIPRLLEDARFAGKDDGDLKRLAQYKLLERRREDEQRSGGDNTEFLRTSGIRVSFDYDLEANVERAIELINRTNQLNFTKRRLPDDPAAARAEYLALIRKNNVRGALIAVQDNYGDYGVVGLYILKNRDLVHFCFSCRTLHMGVEEYVYDSLDRPRLAVQGDVLTDLFRARAPVDWINQATPDGQARRATPLPGVRARGACDLEAIMHYLRSETTQVVGEFSSLRAGMRIRLDHSAMLRLSLETQDPRVSTALGRLGYRPADFQTHLLDEVAPGTVIVFSNWADAHLRVYRHVKLRFLVPFHLDCYRGDIIAAKDAAVGPALKFPKTARAIGVLRRRYEHVGPLPPSVIAANLREIFKRVPVNARLFVLSINEMLPDADGVLVRNARRQRMNRVLRRVAAAFEHVELVDVSRYITSPEQVQGLDHFDRAVYWRIAQHIIGRTQSLVAEVVEATSAGSVHAPMPPGGRLRDVAELAA